jgi:uncharacterized membrane protein YeiH
LKPRTEVVVLAADLAGTCVFAIEGAIEAMRAGLDLLGIMVVAFVASLGGGVLRDLLIGAAPPSAIRDWRYPALALLAGALAFICHAAVPRIPAELLIVLDAAGLSLFAVAGAEKALSHGIHPFVAALMGALTGVGGGVVRDMLLVRVPAVLHTDIYASAALLGAAVVLVARRMGLAPALAGMTGGVACFVLRLVAVSYGWHLPKVAAF